MNEVAALPLNQKVIEILRNTGDGEKLEPWHLSLMECAVNGNVSDYGIDRVDEIYRSVIEGWYRKPRLQGVPSLTVDNQGYIYWREKHVVEHFDRPYAQKQRPYLEELAERCRHIEGLGLSPSTNTVVCRWTWLSETDKDDPWLSLYDSNLYEIAVRDEQELLLSFHYDAGEVEAYVCDGKLSLSWPDDHEWNESYHRRRREGWKTPALGQASHLGITCASRAEVVCLLETHQVPPDIATRAKTFYRDTCKESKT